jgi:nucleotide-binding universal stress UspA family protein
LAAAFAAMRANAADAVRHCAHVASEQTVSQLEERIIDDDACGLALHARYADLVVVSPPEARLPTRGSAGELPGYLLRECGRPLLVVPREAGETGLQGEILLAWNGSVEAIHALMGALPLMRMAKGVSIVHADDGRSWPDEDRISSQALVRYLYRHGISARVRSRQGGRFDVAGTLLSAAADCGAGLLVMGGYGRSPLHESLLGGVTAAVLRTITLPVLLAH